MTITLDELKARLAAEFDVILLLELLQVTPELLLDAFEDIVVERRDELIEALEIRDDDSGEQTDDGE